MEVNFAPRMMISNVKEAIARIPNFAKLLDRQGWSFLMLLLDTKAEEKDIFDDVQLLVEAGADLDIWNSIGQTPLTFALPRRYDKIVKLFLEHGADPDNQYEGASHTTPLHWAACYANLNTFKVVVAHSKNLNIEEYDGMNPYTGIAGHGGVTPLDVVYKHGVTRRGYRTRLAEQKIAFLESLGARRGSPPKTEGVPELTALVG